MYISTIALLLAAAGVKATAVLAQRSPSSHIVNRDISVGWSVQASTKPDGTTQCSGSSSYCPSSLTCNDAANHEVAACCSSSSDCRGDVEGSPKCADSSWSLWIGYDGNGFCCESGMVGAYDITESVAGTCVASVGSLRSAVLTSTGTGAAATSASSSSSSKSTASITSASSASSESSSPASIKVESSASSTESTSAATTTGTITGAASSTAAGSAATPSATTGASDKVGMAFGLMGAAFLAAAAL